MGTSSLKSAETIKLLNIKKACQARLLTLLNKKFNVHLFLSEAFE
jgi:hypothetical protein